MSLRSAYNGQMYPLSRMGLYFLEWQIQPVGYVACKARVPS